MLLEFGDEEGVAGGGEVVVKEFDGGASDAFSGSSSINWVMVRVVVNVRRFLRVGLVLCSSWE